MTFKVAVKEPLGNNCGVCTVRLLESTEYARMYYLLKFKQL